MKQAIKVVSIVLLVTLLVSSVSGIALAAGVPSGTYAGYTPYNWIYSDWFIRKNGPAHPVAVYDWDNTCIYNDIMETMFRFQMFNLDYAMSKDAFDSIIPEAAGKTLKDSSTLKLSADYGNVVLADLAADLEADYAFLYDNYVGTRNMTLGEIKATPEYQDFLVKLPFLYDGLTDTPEIGAEYSYPWVCFLCSGMSKAEVQKMAISALDDALARKSEKITMKAPTGLVRKAAVASYSYKAGIRLAQGVIDMMSKMRYYGWKVWVVTASFEPVIQAVAAINGYYVPEGRVIGVRLQTDASGKYIAKLSDEPGYELTQRMGKATVIRNFIKEAPLFVAGDSDGDYEMMTQFPQTKLIYLVNRVKGGDIGSLYKEALPGQSKEGRVVLLQGRDENAGLWRPFQETIRLGKTAPSPIVP
ncbi:MAG: HAD family hydrolase [Candidatus Cryosericum sp.]